MLPFNDCRDMAIEPRLDVLNAPLQLASARDDQARRNCPRLAPDVFANGLWAPTDDSRKVPYVEEGFFSHDGLHVGAWSPETTDCDLSCPLWAPTAHSWTV